MDSREELNQLLGRVDLQERTDILRNVTFDVDDYWEVVAFHLINASPVFCETKTAITL